MKHYLPLINVHPFLKSHSSCTGNIRNVGQKLYKFLTVKDAESLKTVCTFVALTFSFALGAVPGTLFCLWLSEKAVWICAVILLLLALWMKKASNYIS